MTKEKFEDMLVKHDWWYSSSDDPRKFTEGLEQLNRIQEACKTNSDFKKLYEEKRKEIYNLKDNHGKREKKI
jgi:hypothetical protein